MYIVERNSSLAQQSAQHIILVLFSFQREASSTLFFFELDLGCVGRWAALRGLLYNWWKVVKQYNFKACPN